MEDARCWLLAGLIRFAGLMFNGLTVVTFFRFRVSIFNVILIISIVTA